MAPLKKIRPKKPLGGPIYDPTKKGAKCEDCPLKKEKPVPSKSGRNKLLAIVGEAPGTLEEDQGEYFIGKSGAKLDNGLAIQGSIRTAHHINNVIQCRPREKLSEKEWKQAISCCWPRLKKELKASGAKFLFGVGKRSLQALLAPKKDQFQLKLWAGAPVDLIEDSPIRRGIFSYHPAFCFRGKGHYFPVFYQHLGFALDMAKGKPERPCKKLVVGADRAVLAALKRLAKEKILGYDVETLGKDPGAPLTAVGLAGKNEWVSVLWPPEDWGNFGKAIRFEVKKILRNPRISKVAHNAIYDKAAAKEHGFELKGKIEDTLLMHFVGSPMIPHGLQFACNCEFPSGPWKTRFGDKDDTKGNDKWQASQELGEYNAEDAGRGLELYFALTKRLNGTHRGTELYSSYLRRSDIAGKMREIGVPISTKNQKEHRRLLIRRRRDELREINKLAKKAGWKFPISEKTGKRILFNPLSGIQLRKLYFKILNVKPLRYSKTTGQPSLDKKVLNRYLVHQDPIVAKLSRRVIAYRKWTKLLRSYVERIKIIDRRTYPEPRIWGTKGGRWSYKGSSFNPQVVPPELRNMVASEKGWILEADFSQLELRIMALLSKDPLMNKWYREGMDVHTESARRLFPGFDSKSKRVQKHLRQLGKKFNFTVMYGANAKTTWLVLVTEFEGLLLSDVERMMEMRSIAHPTIIRWQRDLLKLAREEDYVEVPLNGWREIFFGQVEPSKVFNFPIQGTGAALIDRALEGADKEFNWKDEVILFQVHDALICDVMDPKRAARILRRHMEKAVVLDGKKVSFPIDFKIGRNWGDAKEYSFSEVMKATWK